jgi:hypothetical protein
MIVVVTGQCTVIAYLRSPVAKALLLSLPIPFTMATLALGQPVGAQHVGGLALFLGYVHLVRFLHGPARMPIAGAILLSALSYGACGSLLARVVPRSGTAFWIAATATLVVSAGAYRLTPRLREPAYRTPLPLWLKLPIIACVIVTILTLKRALGGFMVAFPMVGVVTAYEARHSLWTVCRQIPVFLTAWVAGVCIVRLLQADIGVGAALPVGWVAHLFLLTLLSRLAWSGSSRTADGSDASDPAAWTNGADSG